MRDRWKQQRIGAREDERTNRQPDQAADPPARKNEAALVHQKGSTRADVDASKRILQIPPERKALHGPQAVQRIGLE
jgi:hypothetical protein